MSSNNKFDNVGVESKTMCNREECKESIFDDFNITDAEIIEYGSSEEEDVFMQTLQNTIPFTKSSISSPVTRPNVISNKHLYIKVVDYRKYPRYFRANRPVEAAMHKLTLVKGKVQYNEENKFSNNVESDLKENIKIRAIKQRNLTDVNIKRNTGLIGMKILGMNDKKKDTVTKIINTNDKLGKCNSHISKQKHEKLSKPLLEAVNKISQNISKSVILLQSTPPLRTETNEKRPEKILPIKRIKSNGERSKLITGSKTTAKQTILRSLQKPPKLIKKTSPSNDDTKSNVKQNIDVANQHLYSKSKKWVIPKTFSSSSRPEPDHQTDELPKTTKDETQQSAKIINTKNIANAKTIKNNTPPSKISAVIIRPFQKPNINNVLAADEETAQSRYINISSHRANNTLMTLQNNKKQIIRQEVPLEDIQRKCDNQLLSNTSSYTDEGLQEIFNNYDNISCNRIYFMQNSCIQQSAHNTDANTNPHRMPDGICAVPANNVNRPYASNFVLPAPPLLPPPIQDNRADNHSSKIDDNGIVNITKNTTNPSAHKVNIPEEKENENISKDTTTQSQNKKSTEASTLVLSKTETMEGLVKPVLIGDDPGKPDLKRSPCDVIIQAAHTKKFRSGPAVTKNNAANESQDKKNALLPKEHSHSSTDPMNHTNILPKTGTSFDQGLNFPNTENESIGKSIDLILLYAIRSRTQRECESIKEYVSIVTGMFARLSEKLSEEEQLKIMINNILPCYSAVLADRDVKSIDYLITICLLFEQSFEEDCSVNESRWGQPYVSQTGNKRFNYTEPSMRPKYWMQRSFNNIYVNNLFCVRCRVQGHSIWTCAAPNFLICFICGLNGFKSTNCPNCNFRKQYNN